MHHTSPRFDSGERVGRVRPFGVNGLRTVGDEPPVIAGCHVDPGFTLRTYAHLMPESEDRARAAIDAALDAPAESTGNANRT